MSEYPPFHFEYRINNKLLPGITPGRIFAHRAGYFEVFSKGTMTPETTVFDKPGMISPAGRQNEYVKEVLGKHKQTFAKYQFIMGILWGDVETKEEVADIFGFRGIPGWPGNPEVDSMVFRNGIHVPNSAIGCGDGLVLLGAFEQTRRTTKSLSDFMSSYPSHSNFPKELEGIHGTTN